MERAFKYRFYPTQEQENWLRRTLGCVRLVYNRALAFRTEAWYQRQARVGYRESSSMLTEWKKEEALDFLNEVSCVPLQQGLRHLQTAFTSFFAGRTNYPNFKKKRNGGSAEFTKSAFRWKDGQVFLAKCTEALPIRWSRQLPKDADPSTITVRAVLVCGATVRPEESKSRKAGAMKQKPKSGVLGIPVSLERGGCQFQCPMH